MINFFSPVLNQRAHRIDLMGLDVNGTKFLLYAQRHGVAFTKMAMVGRQELLLTPDELRSNLKRFGVSFPDAAIDQMFVGDAAYAEGLFNILGAEEIVSFDASPYEGATIIHDLNEPVAGEHKARFSAVLDGGTLEHIFNFPAAIRNCMEMVAVGGHFLAITPTNNHSGHGFYQFSPELFFRIFSAQNGFRLVKMLVFEETPESPWYEVADPDAVGERVALTNSHPSMLLIIAQKTEAVEIFKTMPQQSDYVAQWTGRDGPQRPQGRLSALPFRDALRVPLMAYRKLKIQASRRFGMIERRPKHFKKVELP